MKKRETKTPGAPQAEATSRGSPETPSHQIEAVGAEGYIRAKVESVLDPVIGSVPARGQVVERVVGLMRTEVFRGLLPHPEHLASYERICPGLADRIMRMAETAQIRNEDRADYSLQCEFFDRKLGMCLGFAALISFLGFGSWLIYVGWPYAGGALFGAAALGAVINPFVHGRRKIERSSAPPSMPTKQRAPRAK